MSIIFSILWLHQAISSDEYRLESLQAASIRPGYVVSLPRAYQGVEVIHNLAKPILETKDLERLGQAHGLAVRIDDEKKTIVFEKKLDRKEDESALQRSLVKFRDSIPKPAGISQAVENVKRELQQAETTPTINRPGSYSLTKTLMAGALERVVPHLAEALKLRETIVLTTTPRGSERDLGLTRSDLSRLLEEVDQIRMALDSAVPTSFTSFYASSLRREIEEFEPFQISLLF
ncbi:MAG: hypothetical protein MUC92_02355 [Fimbriimonadaceae bacterium]|nr:hypothetical protein [Fimbriimonadaceae bacterium]